MTRGPVQAGNRASKTGRYLQWWDTGPECTAVTPGVCKVYNYHLFCKLSALLPRVTIYRASLRLLHFETQEGKDAGAARLYPPHVPDKAIGCQSREGGDDVGA